MFLSQKNSETALEREMRGAGGEKKALDEKKSNDGETKNDARRRLLVFWPHVSAGKFYFNRDGELKKSSSGCCGEKKNRDDHRGEKQRSFSRLFLEYENALSKETRMGMLRSNFYEGEERLSILSLFACARVCVSHANRIDWALDILTNFSAKNNNYSAANEARKMAERAREILGDEYFENDDDDEEEDEDEEMIQMDPMELAMARMSGKSSSTTKKTTTTKRRKRRGKEVSLRSRVQMMNEFDEYIARQKPNGYVDFMCYCSFCGYPDGIEQAIKYRNRAANINVPHSKKLFLHRGWRWLKRLDDIDRRFDFFTRDTRSTNNTNKKEEIEETTLLFRIQLAKYVETVAILEGSARNNDGTNEDHELETMAAFRRNCKKNKNVRVNSLDTLLENTTYIILADNARRWSTYLYAYTTPTVAALKALNRVVDGKNIKWLEIGAGKGVWARAMQRFGIDVIATDSMPEAGNDYHLITASSNDDDDNIVEKMTHLEAIKKYSGRANGLFVCYPPPDSNMGSTSLKAFKGEYVAVIGEDLLNTGDIEMFAILNDHFKVSERVYLPQWIDTAHHLTIFKRRRESGERAKKVAKIEIKRRCRVCRWDRELFSTVEEHEQEHYLRFLPKVKTFSENELYETVAL